MAAAIKDRLVSAGIGEVHADGIIAGIYAESGLDHKAENPSSKAFGIGQWLGSRKSELIKRYGDSPSLEQQVDYLVHELKGGDEGGKHVLAAATAEDAAHAYIVKFMRPAKGQETTSDLDRASNWLGTTIATEMKTVPHNAILTLSDREILYGKTAPDQFVKPVEVAPTQKQFDAAALGGAGQNTAPDTSFSRIDATSAADYRDAVADHKAEEAISPLDIAWGRLSTGPFTDVVSAVTTPLFTGGADPGWPQWKRDNLDQIYKDGIDNRGIDDLLNSSSWEDYQVRLMRRADKRQVDTTQATFSEDAPILGFVAGLGGDMADPLNIGATVATGGLFKVTGVGSAALRAAGRPLLGAASTLAEGTVGNVAITGSVHLAGQPMGIEDYSNAAFTGMMFSSMFLPFQFGGDALAKHGATQRRQAQVRANTLVNNAVAQLGPNATPQQIIQHANQASTKPGADLMQDAVTAEASADVFFPREAKNTIFKDEKTRDAYGKARGLDMVADTAEKNQITEAVANAERIDQAYPVDEAGLTKFTALLPGGESIGMTMLKSKNVVLRAASKVLLESTTGAAGRRTNAAIVQQVQERMFLEHLRHFDELKRLHFDAEGHNAIMEATGLSQRGTRDFDTRLFYEIEARAKNKTVDKSKVILEAADRIERLAQDLLDAQKRGNVAGWTRLPDSAKGYFPHKLSASEVQRRGVPARRALAQEYARQFQDVENGFDKDFAERLGKKMVHDMLSKYAGEAQIPATIHDPDAGDTVRDLLKAMNVKPDDAERFMGALGRGGASHTKKRLRLDMFAEIKDENGEVFKLGDLYEHDAQKLFTAQARRVSGEIALARHNIPGVKGLKLLREAAVVTGNHTEKELAAFDTMAAEFLNTPISDKRHVWMDNIGVATSAARLGLSVFNQVGDYANALPALGVQRAFSAVKDLPALFKQVGEINGGKNPADEILHSFDKHGFVGLDDYLMNDLFDGANREAPVYGSNNVGTFGRFVRKASNAQYIASFHKRLIAVQSRGMAKQILQKALVFVRDGKNDKALADMGFSPKLMERLKGNLDKIAKFDGNKLSALDIHAGDLSGRELLELRTILDRGGGQLVQRVFKGESGVWVHDSLLRLLYQFRGASITAAEKQWSRTVFNHGHLMAFGTMMGGMSWAIPIHLARVNLRTIGMNEEKRQEYLERNLNPMAVGAATMNYVLHSGFANDVINVSATFASALGGPEGKALAENLGQGARPGGTALIGGTILPSAGLVNDAWTGLHGRPDKLMKTLPGANMLYVQPFFNALGNDK